VEAVSYLARYHQRRGNRKSAERFIQMMLETNGPEKEEAKQLQRELYNDAAAMQ
jgi:cytochrome c-type biogenesis protein CcmH/NrfG